MIKIAVAFLGAAMFAADGGAELPAYRAAEPVLRVSFELASDGGIVSLPALPDGGVVAVVLTPEKAVELANERQEKDWELARLRSAPHPATVVGLILGTIQLAFSAIPAIVEAVRRQP